MQVSRISFKTIQKITAKTSRAEQFAELAFLKQELAIMQNSQPNAIFAFAN